MCFKISECFDTHCTCILGDLAVLKSAFQGPKSGHRGVGEAALGTVGGFGRPNCLLGATRQQNENAQARAQAVISEIAGGVSVGAAASFRRYNEYSPTLWRRNEVKSPKSHSAMKIPRKSGFWRSGLVVSSVQI